MTTTKTAIPAKRFDFDAEEAADALVETETDDGRVSLHIDPRTDDVVTAELSSEDAWRLSRELARAATQAEEERR